MEGKKVLWVVFSIALALVVILAAGLFLLRPRQPKSSEASGAAAPSLLGYDPYEYVRGTSAPPGLTTPPAEPQPKVIVVGEPPAQERAPQERAAAAAPALGREGGLPPSPIAQQGPPPEQTPKERAPQERAAAAAAATPQVARAPAPPPERAIAAAEPAAALERPARERVGAPPARVSRPRERVSTAARPKAVSVTEYWIQAGSFSSAARADEVSRRLEDRGLAPRTTTRDLNGKTHFRVRVGPYTSKAEAEKFLGWIRELKGFETSYISMVASRRSMP